jgi:hypothetical protein
MTWVSSAPMLKDRYGFDAVVLGDGTVLAVGDDHSCQPGGAVPGSERADLYSPGSDTWTEADSLNKPRKSPATVGLRDGSAMVIGGINSDDYPFSSTKIFSTATGGWSDGPLLDRARGQPLAATLDDGRILVADFAGDTTSEVYDPRTSDWSRAASLPETADIWQMVALTGHPDDLVLATGYDHTDSEPQPAAYLYDPTRDEWGAVDAPSTFFDFELVALPDGDALAIGGQEGGELAGGDAVRAQVDRLDPDTGRWTPVAPMSTPRLRPQVAVLQDGRVVVTGGASGGDFDSSARILQTTEVYDPRTDRWTAGGDLLEPRRNGLAVVLQDGSVLVLGGDAELNGEGDTPFCPPPLTSTERLDPGT